MTMALYLILTISVCAMAIMMAIYAKYRNGLATRLFGLVFVQLGTVCMLGYLIGHVGEMWTLPVSAAVAIAVVVPSLYFLYRVVVARVGSLANSIFQSAAELTTTAKETAATAVQQSATVNEISSAVSELTETSTATAAFADQVVSASANVVVKGEEGMKAVDEARSVLELISQVGEIVEAIREFAGQSNLLAVNARVEAAKAGEQGRGFAVVASEIRSLSEQSKESAQRIWKAVSRAEEGRRALDDASKRMRDLLSTLATSEDSARQIAATVGQQSAGILQISQAILNVAEGGKASVSAAAQVEQAVLALRGVAAQLETYVTGTEGEMRWERTT